MNAAPGMNALCDTEHLRAQPPNAGGGMSSLDATGKGQAALCGE